jgi:hypothetical protein
MTGKTVVKLVKLVKKLFNNDEVTNFWISKILNFEILQANVCSSKRFPPTCKI